MCQFDWPIIPKKRNNGDSPKQKALFWTVQFFPFGPPIGERRTPFSKTYGIKVKRYGNCWEQRKNGKKWHIPLFHWEQRTREHDAYILTLDLGSVCLVVVGLGFTTQEWHMWKKRNKWSECFPILWSHLCDYEIPICWFIHHSWIMLSSSICNLLSQPPFLSTPLVFCY